MISSIFSVALLVPGALSYTLPNTLFSPLIPSKIHSYALSEQSNDSTPSSYPQYTTTTTGQWIDFVANEWTTGFFPSTLYALAQRTKICRSASARGNWTTQEWIDLGRSWATAEIPLETNNTQGHDVGFLSFPFRDELTVNPTNATAIHAVNAFAADLAARFSPIVGCTRSWDTADPTDFTVIIDNMMNLDVLLNSYALTGNETLLHIAKTHADTTIINHFRDDGSTWHVVEYNSTTGIVIRKRTSQGYSDNSTWSRGQAWAISGYANMYHKTGQFSYLNTSRRAATYFIDHTPKNDWVVPWDFNAPPTLPYADTSASTIAANGLLLLSQVETDWSLKQHWLSSAIHILNGANSFWAPTWQSLLANGTVNEPANNQLTGIVYGDYYYVTAGNTLVQMGLASC